MEENKAENTEQVEESKPLLGSTETEIKTDEENISEAPHIEKEQEEVKEQVEPKTKPAEVPEQFWDEEKIRSKCRRVSKKL